MGREQDHAIVAADALRASGQYPTYDWLKHSFGRTQVSTEVFESLNRGRAILTTVDQLDQYLYTYSPMIASQWEFALGRLDFLREEALGRLVDYGCGQGLAGLLMSEALGADFLEDIATVIAIEPSTVALRRAAAIYRALAPDASIVPINKDFDALTGADLAVGDGPTLHLFSNVLDIDGYDHVALLRKGLTAGDHLIVAVGHDRTRHGYSQGLERVKAAVDDGTIRPGVQVDTSTLTPFTCRNEAMMWVCRLEVDDG